MAQAMNADSDKSPAARVMDEAIELAIEERSPYPEKAAFLDADEPSVGSEINAIGRYPPPLTVCSGTVTAFGTNAATVNLRVFNQLRGVSAFAPIFRRKVY